MNQIALFKGMLHSKTGLLIGLGTLCDVVHAAVYVEADGRWWHASESLGCVGLMDLDKYRNRWCFSYPFEGDLSDWLEKNRQCDYDWESIWGWVLYRLSFGTLWRDNANKLICFEFAESALSAGAGYPALPRPLAGCHLREAARSGIRFSRFGALL